MTEEAGKVFERPKRLESNSVLVDTGCGHLYVTVSYYEGAPVEMLASLGKAGTCVRAMLEALTRSITLGIKYGVPVDEFVKELRDIRCPSRGIDQGVEILSCADAIGRVLEVS